MMVLWQQGEMYGASDRWASHQGKPDAVEVSSQHVLPYIRAPHLPRSCLRRERASAICSGVSASYWTVFTPFIISVRANGECKIG